MTKLKYATARIKAIKTWAVCSEDCWHLDELKPGPVVLYLRVSSRSQNHNLKHQKSRLLAEAERRGFRVIDTFGKPVKADARWSFEFERAILKAKETGVPVVAVSMDRFGRCFTARDEKTRLRKPLPLNVFEMRRLMAEADGVQLATLIHPDTPEEQMHSEQTKYGQRRSGHYGGRPKESKKDRRERLSPRALELRAAGWGYGKIAKELNVPLGTIREWVDV